MNENQGYIKARLKTHEQLVRAYPDAENWGKPLEPGCLFRSADEVILPFLGNTIWVRKKRIDLNRIFFEIQDTGGLIVLPDWIEHFDTTELVPPAKWDNPDYGVVDDIWLEPFEEDGR